MKVLHLPTTVGGNPQGLSHHLQALGVESETWILTQNTFGYPADKVILLPTDSRLQRWLKKLTALRYVLQDYDIVHFNFGQTLFSPAPPSPQTKDSWLRRIRAVFARAAQWLELSILRFRQVPLFVHYQGDDARQGDFCRNHFDITIAKRVDESYYNSFSDDHKRLQIKRLSHFCSKIYALNPDLLYVLPPQAEFIPYSHISLQDWTPVYNQLENRPLRIGHAPSHRQAKGTDLLLDALNHLSSQGYDFELVLVENKPHAEAMRCYQDIDVLVDQLFAGWYGGLAVEAMALGKPVLVYIRESDLHFIPTAMRRDLPFIQVDPTSLEVGLKKVLEMPRQMLYELAQKSRAFVEKWHDPIAIAQRIKTDYEQALIQRGKL
nr:hypothetical protein [Nodosilinea sp. TSF1-S3]MDF0364665.1 hypothetical protein [Nodosilinea sp. TSF1-S3]